MIMISFFHEYIMIKFYVEICQVFVYQIVENKDINN